MNYGIIAVVIGIIILSIIGNFLRTQSSKA